MDTGLALSSSSSESYSSGEEDSIGGRPKKRRRISGSPDTEHSGPNYQQIVLEELDLEIALRQRLYDTIQSRITWAALLQESLDRDLQDTEIETSDFQAAALDALDAIEAPCNVLFAREVNLPVAPILPLPKLPPNSVETPQTLPRTGTIRTRGLPRPPPQPVRKLLFLRDMAADPPTIAKLACPDCARFDFSNLQGLLNHCRIRHQREYGSHDECMQSCAVLVPETEREWVVSNGTEVGGISLPSLRRLFEIAVGSGEQVTIPGVSSSPANNTPARGNSHVVEETAELASTSSHITRTLGHHADTPALAPFLGRKPHKRRINLYDENDSVDIFAGLERHTGSKHKWCMSYNHRNIARPALDEVPPTSDPPGIMDDHDHDGPHTQGTLTVLKSPSSKTHVVSSRFHIVARVNIADSSLWLYPNHRPEPRQHHTHQWRLAITSPSYSLHITTFLAKLTITCLTDPPPSTLVEPIVVTEPPFVVTSTADKPFLARLTFAWVGSKNLPMDVEHWVELDPAHLAHPVDGDDQVFDVELDRNTELSPVRADVYPITWDVERSGRGAGSASKGRARADKQESATPSGPDYGVRLRALLPQVPMTLRETRGRAPPRVPYFLPSTLAHFRAMVPGRRKAIEMGRARALQLLYVELCASHPEQSDVPLSLGDVYRWMLDENLFPRGGGDGRGAEQKTRKGSALAVPGSAPASAGADRHCAVCGAHRSVHPAGIKSEDTDSKMAPVSTLNAGLSACEAFRTQEEVKMPLLDVHRLLSFADVHQPPYALPAVMFAPHTPMPLSDATLRELTSSADLVAIADPQLTTAIGALTPRQRSAYAVRPSQTASRGASLAERTELDASHEALVDRLAPHALLATATTLFMRLLLQRGVDAFRHDEAVAHARSRYERPRRAVAPAVEARPARVLTPAHIVRGLAAGARRAPVDAAALLALARLGDGSPDMSRGTPGAEVQDGGAVVKMEVGEA